MKKYAPLVAFVCLCSLQFLSAQINHQQRITLDPSMKPFYHGVESGDPMSDHVIIWTRITPDTGMVGDIDVYWQIATDTNFTNVVNYGKLVATEANHYCVKADVCGLQPATYYYYMFQSGGKNSIIGRTKTAPGPNADIDSVRFAVVSCASWEHGYFNAYESVTKKDNVDAVVHLGDYIYEYASGDFSSNVSGRTYDPPTEAITEVGYELRYSQYKLDKQLQRIHQLFPFITVWDDHETANDAWKGGAENHTPGTEGNYADRKHNSTSTYFKWMPIRKPDPADTIRIFRKLRYGKLLDLIMLDTRLYDRDEQDLNATDDSTHHLMGPVERAWFMQQLSDTSTRWKIVGNQVMFAPLQVFGQPVNADQWDGYNYERTQIENHILNNNIKDVVILTGDIHTSWCNDVPGPNYNANTGAGSVCVEFVGSSVTSLNSPLPVGINIIQALNPHMKYINLNEKGYYMLNVNRQKTQADYTYMNTVTQLGTTDLLGPSYYVNDNERFLRSGTAISNAPKNAAAAPPVNAKQNIGMLKITDHYLSTPENTQVSVNIIPSLQMCPQVVMTLSDPANHGGSISLNGQDVTYVPSNNYNGTDTVAYAICTLDTVPVCDTIYLYINVIAVQDVDAYSVNVVADSSYSNCVSFDDLTGAMVSFTHTNAQHGVLTVTDTCFTYVPDSTYCGIDTVLFKGCDAGYCDTVIYYFRINHPVFASVMEFQINKNTNLETCNLYDDLTSPLMSKAVLKMPSNGTLQLEGDTCVRYYPYFNYIGTDTIRMQGCDFCGFNHCDTLTLIYHIEEPNAVTEPEQLIVFGMFPNPINDKLIVQYYMYEAGSIEFNIYDETGRMISTDKVHSGSGLQYAQLNTLALPVGNYIAEVKTDKGSYRRKVVKE